MNVLKKDKRLYEGNNLNKPLLFELLETYDKKLFELLISDKKTREKYFIKIGESYVFKYEDFRLFIEQNNLDGSHTKYENTIGLSNRGKFLSESTDYVLDWPYKDTVLEGGMSSEEDEDTYIEKKVETTPGKIDGKTGTVISTEKTEVSFSEVKGKREEIFYNNIIAEDEIDKLLDKKALKNFKRYTAKGEEEVKEIKRDEDGTIKENLLIKGNNLLALHSLKEQFAGKVKLIYIDPPYNTGGSEEIFTYNNRFNHSTWLTFMKNRLEVAEKFLREDGFIAIAIDHAELFYLGALSDEIFGRDNRIGLVTVVHKPEGRQHSKFFSPSNEYMLVYAKNKEMAKFNKVVLLEEKRKEFNESDEQGLFKWKEFIRKDTLKNQKKAGFYPIHVSKDLKKISTKKFAKALIAYPVDSKGTERVWNVQEKGFNDKLKNGEIKAEIIDGKVKIFYKIREQQVFVTHWTDKRYNSTANGTFLVKKYLDGKSVSYPKSIYTVEDTIKIMTNDGDLIVDFFAGSSTTAHAILNLDVEEKTNRQFIMIEQVDEHYQVSKTRLSKVIVEKLEKEKTFLTLELVEYNEEAKNKIDSCKTYKDLKKLFVELTDNYFLNYNVSIKEFNEKILNDKDFEELPLDEQKTLFKALLDNNQLYISYDEQDDPRFNLSKEDKNLTEMFYE